MPENRNIHLITTSDDGNIIAAADRKTITVFDLTDGRKFELPKRDSLATAIKITKNELIAVYSDLTFIEYDLKRKEYTQFSRQLNKPVEWSKRNLTIQNISADSTNSDIIYLHDTSGLIILDKSKDAKENISPEKQSFKSAKLDNSFDSNSSSSSNSKCKSGAFTFIDRANLVLFFSEISQNQLVSVEMNQIALEDKLPPALKIKKFAAA